jgi:hypothetical protein
VSRGIASLTLEYNIPIIYGIVTADTVEQAINRVHRLNSTKPVNVYSIICEGSIDRKLEAMIQEKGDACELVLDGHLMGEQQEEVNLAELLEIARREFDPKSKTVDEAKLDAEWPAMRQQLSTSQQAWEAARFGTKAEARTKAEVRSQKAETPRELVPLPAVPAVQSLFNILPSALPAVPAWLAFAGLSVGGGM